MNKDTKELLINDVNSQLLNRECLTYCSICIGLNDYVKDGCTKVEVIEFLKYDIIDMIESSGCKEYEWDPMTLNDVFIRVSDFPRNYKGICNTEITESVNEVKEAVEDDFRSSEDIILELEKNRTVIKQLKAKNKELAEFLIKHYNND